MKRFKFKLANVLKYRETLENLAKNAYSEALHYLNVEKDKLKELEARREELKSAYNVRPGAVIDPESLSFLSFYTAQLIYLIQKRKEIVRQKEAVAQEKFEEWNHRRKDVKVIKRLEEKKWRDYLREADKEEQKFQDEIFIAKTVRGMER